MPCPAWVRKGWVVAEESWVGWRDWSWQVKGLAAMMKKNVLDIGVLDRVGDALMVKVEGFAPGGRPLGKWTFASRMRELLQYGANGCVLAYVRDVVKSGRCIYYQVCRHTMH